MLTLAFPGTAVPRDSATPEVASSFAACASETLFVYVQSNLGWRRLGVHVLQQVIKDDPNISIASWNSAKPNGN
jgi:hypothetical protein